MREVDSQKKRGGKDEVRQGTASKGIYDFLYIALFAILAFCILTFFYTDFMDTLDNAVLLVESIVKGRFLDYYQYAAENIHPDTVYPANYNIFMYLVFAIWNFPAVLLHIFTGADYMNNLFAVLWCKGLICVSLAACVSAIKKIVCRLGADKTEASAAGFLFLSSMATLLSAFIAVQYDSIMLAFVLWGIYYYGEGNRKKAILLFSLAVPLKLFAVFIIIPVILVYEKNLLKAAGCVLAAFVPQVTVSLPFLGDKTYQMAIHSQSSDAMDLLLNGAKAGQVNLFFLLLVIVCIFCFMSGREEDTEIGTGKLYRSVYASFAVFAGFCFLTTIRSYWLILFVPFMVVLVFAKKDNRVPALLFELGAGLGSGIYYLIQHHIYSHDEIIRKLILRFAFTQEGLEERYGSLAALLRSTGLFKYAGFFLAAAGACVICFVIIRFPGRKVKEIIPSDGTRAVKWLMAGRLCAIVCVLAVFLYAKLVMQPVICAGYDFNQYEEQEEGRDEEDVTSWITTSGIEQEVVFDEARSLSAFEIMLKQTGYERSVRDYIVFELDDAGGNAVWQDEIGMTEIGNTEDGTLLRLNIEDVDVEAGLTYVLKISRTITRPRVLMQAYACKDRSGNIKYCFR